jgi:FKBP-type peptidyl-prolyl cis-trans isomerase 2
MTLKKKDFIEVEFTGKVKEGEVFDSTRKEELEKGGVKGNPKPFIYSIGTGMFLKGVDDYLEGKDIGEHEISLKAEEAFGKRDPKLIQMIPMKVFRQHNINPVQGAAFNFDGKIAKILSVSGGRVVVDFNNQLAGKEVVYNLKILRKVEDLDEKIKALNDFLFRKELKYEVKDKKIIFEIEDQLKQMMEIFKGQYKDIFGLDVEIKEVEKK